MIRPINLREWIYIVGILIIVGLLSISLMQLPSINNMLNNIGDYIGIQNEFIY